MVEYNLAGEDVTKVRRQQFEVSAKMNACRKLSAIVLMASSSACVPRTGQVVLPLPRLLLRYTATLATSCVSAGLPVPLRRFPSPCAAFVFPASQNYRNQQEITKKQRADMAMMEAMTGAGPVEDTTSKWKVWDLVGARAYVSASGPVDVLLLYAWTAIQLAVL